jgi:predicted transcriptional regulator
MREDTRVDKLNGLISLDERLKAVIKEYESLKAEKTALVNSLAEGDERLEQDINTSDQVKRDRDLLNYLASYRKDDECEDEISKLVDKLIGELRYWIET